MQSDLIHWNNWNADWNKCLVCRTLQEQVRQKMFPLYLVYVSIGSFSMPLGGLPGPGPWDFWRGGGKVKFVFFEKATKFDEISILLLTNRFVLFVSRYSFEHQSGSQSWNFIHWDQPNPSKVYLCLDTDKFVLSFLLISNKNQLCRI